MKIDILVLTHSVLEELKANSSAYGEALNTIGDGAAVNTGFRSLMESLILVQIIKSSGDLIFTGADRWLEGQAKMENSYGLLNLMFNRGCEDEEKLSADLLRDIEKAVEKARGQGKSPVRQAS